MKTQLARLVQEEMLPDVPPLPKGAGREAVLGVVRPWLAAQKQQLKEDFLASQDAAKLLVFHTVAVDALMGALFRHFKPKKASGLAVVAVGGYGRSKLFPYSDIDLLFLHDGDTARTGDIASDMLYVLWDLGLAVGQAHLSVEEALSNARLDITARSNLLDARFLVGDEALFEEFVQRFEGEIMAGGEMEFVDAKLAERDARHKRFGDSRYMLEPNVKEGKGGLRDLHTLWWLVRYVYPIRELDDMVQMGLLTAEEFEPFNQARQFLYRVRANLHYQAGRAEERLTFDRQYALAQAMGFSHPSEHQAVSRFMKRYFVAVRTVGMTTRIFCALLEDEHKRRPKKALAALWHAPWKLGGFKLEGERLTLRSHQSFAYNPLLMLEMFHISQLHGIDIHPKVLQQMAAHLHLIDDKMRREPLANQLFLSILLSENDPETTLRRMSEAGVLGKFIPDFGRVIGQTQFNMYHIYTVDEHTLVAIGILHAIAQGSLEEELPLASEVMGRIAMTRVLYLALFCHDIAKGRGGDHSELGEKVVSKLAGRMGFSREETQMAAWLVRHHLLFSNTAFKRDANDPKTLQDFVAKLQNSERLKLLYMLTVVDMRAVSPGVWNSWKAALLEELYLRAEQAMGTGPVARKSLQAAQFTAQLAGQLAGWKAEEVEGYTQQCDPAMLSACSPAQHAAIARMLKEARRMDSPVLLDTQHDYERGISEITVCTPDRPGLFSMLAGALALAGANIISAKIFTLKGGMAVDMFQLQDMGGDLFDRPDRLAKLAVYIEQVLSGELLLAEAFSKQAAPRREAMPVAGQVFVENNASNICTVIELAGHDRPGFLYQVTDAMLALGLSIVTAHISTYGTQVADVFYVKDAFGMKLLHESKIKQVREALLGVMG